VKNINRSFIGNSTRLDQIETSSNQDMGSVGKKGSIMNGPAGYVNYINGVQVESPIPKKKKIMQRNEKLPQIKSTMPNSTNVSYFKDSEGSRERIRKINHKITPSPMHSQNILTRNQS
jgi:hypothetical protein